MKNKKSASLLIAAVLFIGSFSFANAIEYGMLGGKPANPNLDVENGDSWFIYGLNAGEKKEDAIQVMNLFAVPNSVLVYAADTTPSSSGGFALKQFSEPKDEVGGWVKFYPEAVPEIFDGVFKNKENKIISFCQMSREDLDKERGKAKTKLTDAEFSVFTEWCAGKSDLKIDLKGNEKLTVPFVFSVADNADVGEHTGGILIQKVAADDAQTQGSAVKLTTRVGVRIYETVPGDIVRKISLEGSSFSRNFREFDFSNWFAKKEERKAEEFSFNVRIKNEGNASATVRDVIHLKDRLFGSRSMDVEDRSFQVLKNDVFVSSFSWNSPRFGSFRLEREIKYQDVAGQEHTIVVDPVSFWIIPWREMAVAFVFLLLLAAAYAGWKYQHKKKYGGLGWKEYKVKKSDTVLKLAEKYKVDWKVLIRTNKLKAPYILEPGQAILIPPTGKKGKGGKDFEEAENLKAEKTEERPPENEEAEEISEKAEPAAEPVAEKPKTKKAKKVDAIVRLARRERKEEIVITSGNWYKNKIVWIVVAVIIFLLIVIVVLLVNNKRKNSEINQKISITSLGSKAAPQDGQAAEENAKPAEKSEEAEKEKLDVAKVGVKILNGGAAPGSAVGVKDMLSEKGFKKAAAGNAENSSHIGQVIYYQKDFKAVAEEIQAILKASYTEVLVKEGVKNEEKSADVVIMLGK